MPEHAALREQLRAFAAHLRDPEAAPVPDGVDVRGAGVYRRLVFDNLGGLLGGVFPVARRLLGKAAWQALVADFLREWRCRTPLFPGIGGEFLQYLAQRGDAAGDPPWLQELAHYEWIELALDLSDADPGAIAHDPDDDLLAGRPLLSPLCRVLAYAWPVHRLRPDAVPATPPPRPTFLLVRRDETQRVRFDEISALTFRLLQSIADDTGATGHALLLALAAEARAADTDAFVAEGAVMLARLREARVVGCRSQEVGGRR
ncbi:DNA-binding domain-containing protein [Arenimonas composti]|uniref:Uncharacterized protein n=1 Tax=Arenimonas composti TR7-09 = DSM 18010 TaxID=1121013 RepID=A0A091BHS7_9GAMM|nr:putative DNA-binding domain-containing protein [Arenimonas composti]KFN50329.1 hypothetical protein P873_06545 [Arenimonas composti TR7-09 = DSM 18010]